MEGFGFIFGKQQQLTVYLGTILFYFKADDGLVWVGFYLFFDQEIIIWVDFDLNGAGLDLMKEDIGLVWAGNNNLG